MNTAFANHALVALLGVSLLGLTACGRKPALVQNTAPQNALGEIVGEEAARLAGPGAKVLVLAPTASDPAGMSIEPVLKSFAAALAKHGNVTIAATERVKARMSDPSPTREELTAAQLDKLVRGAAGASAVVSFVGFPVLAEAEIAELKKRNLKFVAIYTAGPQAGPHYKKLLEARVLDVAILPRMELPPAAAQIPTKPRDFFDRNYQLATPETAAQLTP